MEMSSHVTTISVKVGASRFDVGMGKGSKGKGGRTGESNKKVIKSIETIVYLLFLLPFASSDFNRRN
jgi:hypothetical protein